MDPKYPVPPPAERRGGSFYLVGDELIPEDDREYLSQRLEEQAQPDPQE